MGFSFQLRKESDEELPTLAALLPLAVPDCTKALRAASLLVHIHYVACCRVLYPKVQRDATNRLSAGERTQK